MGFLEEINSLDLSDDVKQKLIREHSSEVDPLKNENDTLKSRDRRSTVEDEVKSLGNMGFSEAPGLLKYARRVLLSPDAEEPGAVLLSDNEMGLSGDLATGATGREEVSAAKVLRTFISLMPTNDQGKVNLSDVAVVTDAEDRPASGNKTREEETDEHRSGLEKVTGRSLKRTRNRYRGGVPAPSGGDS